MISALDIFERESVTALPLDPARLARQAGASLVTYQTLAGQRPGALLLRQAGSADGFTFVHRGQAVVAYNHQIESLGRQRWTLVHELCHLWLGHLDRNDSAPDALTLFPGRSAQERAADLLCAQLLAPLPVIHLCGVETPNELAALCGLSTEAATYRLRELATARRAGRLLRTEEEQRLVARFLPFISDSVSAAAERRAGRRLLQI